MYNKKLHQKAIKLEEYSNNKLIRRELYFHNHMANKYKAEHYNLNNLIKITFYDMNESLEEEHLLNDKGKILTKRFFSRSGKLVKEIKN